MISVTLAGYFVGRQVPVLADYLDRIILVVIISSPLVWMLAWMWGRTRKGNAPAQTGANRSIRLQ